MELDDYRVKTGWRKSHKRKKLRLRLGPDGVIALEDLWSFCAESRPDGDLIGLSNDDIALEVDWLGDADKFVSTLVECRLLDGEDGAYRIHDWDEHNPYVSGSPGRSASARANAHVRYHVAGRHQGRLVEDCPMCDSHAVAAAKPATAVRSHANRSAVAAAKPATAEIRTAPDPDPIPSPDPDPIPAPPHAVAVRPQASRPIHTAEDLEQLVASDYKWAVALEPALWPLAQEISERAPVSPSAIAIAKERTDERARTRRGKPHLFLQILLELVTKPPVTALVPTGTGPPERLSRKGEDIRRALKGSDPNMFKRRGNGPG